VFEVDPNAENKYQMKAKPCYVVFHNVNNVEKCTIRLDDEDQKLVFDLQCKRSIKKTSKLAIEQSEAMQAIYSKEACRNKIVARPKQLVESLPNFHSHLDEITLAIAKDGLKLMSYADDHKGTSMKMLHTELHMDQNDFEEFKTEEFTEVTFSLKEFKAIVNLCEVIGQPCTLHIERGGRPMIVSLKYFDYFEADFVLATLVSQNSPQNSQGSSSGSSGSSASPYASNTTPKITPNYPRKPQTASTSPATVTNKTISPYAASQPSLIDTADSTGARDAKMGQKSTRKHVSTPYQHSDSEEEDDERVDGSPMSSPKKKAKAETISKVLGRDLDMEDEDEEMDDSEVIPSSCPQ